MDLTDKAEEMRTAFLKELEDIGPKVEKLMGFTETQDLSIPDELKMFKTAQQQRIRDVGEIEKLVKKVLSAASKQHERIDMQDVLEL